MEYISLHGYIKNTPSDTEVQEYLISGKEYIDMQNLIGQNKMEEYGQRKTECTKYIRSRACAFHENYLGLFT